MTTGVSHRLRLFESSTSKEVSSVDDITKSPTMLRF
jgi:hypothetical protein